jgi:hypothetical protein
MSGHDRRLAIVLALGVGAAAVLAAPGRARAQAEALPEHDVDLGIDGMITGIGAVGTVLAMLIPVDSKNSWDHELFGGFDDRVKGNFSSSAAKLADGLLVTTVAVPAALMLGGELDDGTRDRFLIYAESISMNLVVNSLAKYLVQRPRPYTYNTDPRVEEVERAQGKDSRLSFYSAHAAIGFGSAVTGSYIYGARTADANARAVVWGVELATAAATANLRVRAGKHFYSDVIIGSLVGAGIGFLVPALHADEGAMYTPSGREYAAMAAGVVVGVVGSQLLPLHDDVLVRLGGGEVTPVTMQLQPMALPDGAGLAAVGTF